MTMKAEGLAREAPKELTKFGVRWKLTSSSAWQVETPGYRIDVSSSLPFGRRKVRWVVQGFSRADDNVLRLFADCTFSGDAAEDIAFRAGSAIYAQLRPRALHGRGR